MHAFVRDALHEVLGYTQVVLEEAVEELLGAPAVVASIGNDQVFALADQLRAQLSFTEDDALLLASKLLQSNKRRKVETAPPPEAAGGASRAGAPSVTPETLLSVSTQRRDIRFKESEEYMTKLREEARREYLAEREASQLELAHRILEDRADDEAVDATVQERLKELNRVEAERLALAEKLKHEREANKFIHSYTLPDQTDDTAESKLKLLKEKFEEKSKAVAARDAPHDQRWALERIAEAGYGEDRVEAPQKFLDEDLVEFEAGGVKSGVAIDNDQSFWDLTLEEREQLELQKKKGQLQKIAADRKSLPVYKFRKQLLEAIRDNPVIIIVGETGNGKTTQIPQYLHEVGYSKLGMIGCTQPRRVAAMSVATRVAYEMNVKLGREVGYVVRFENRTLPEVTKISYMTDGALLQQFMTDPELSEYSCLIIDEAHERSLHTDILFGLVKDLSRYRADDFRLIISSATLEAEKFSEYFDGAPIFKVPGRRFDVDIFYTKTPEANYLDAAAATIMQIHTARPMDGDVLVFLPGQQEIEECMTMLDQQMKRRNQRSDLVVLPIYSSLPPDQQALIFQPAPPGCRKCVLATNIAETSITIDNIVYVVDPGLVKENSYNPRTGLSSLVTVPCSRAACNQRAGRAGRVKPGMCFRLFTKTSWEKELEESNTPEILRCDISQIVLILKNLGIDDLVHFDFMDPPPTQALLQSLELLYHLGALNDQGQLTALGRRMSQLPGNPQIAKMILASKEYKCSEEIIIIAAMLEVANSLFYKPKNAPENNDPGRKANKALAVFAFHNSDHLTMLNIYKAWESSNFDKQWCFDNHVQFRSLNRARDVYDQLASLLPRVEIVLTSCGDDYSRIKKALIAGYFMQAAQLTRNLQYRTVVSKTTVDIHPSSALMLPDDKKQRPLCVIYSELVLTTKEYMRNVTDIESKWLLEVAPHYFLNRGINLTAKMAL